MSFFGNILPFVGDSLGEFASHPLQTLGAVAGVPGYDPFFGGLFNNKPGGALLSPTGNFSSSAWQDMYNRNPGDAAALNQFSGINSVADKIAPMIAGYYAAPGIGAALGGIGNGAAGAGANVGAGLAGTGASGVGAGIGDATAGMAGAGMGTGAAGAGASNLFSAGASNAAGLGTGATWGGAAAAPVTGSGTAGLFSSGAGAGGVTGLLNGPAALGDAGLTGAVSAGGSGMGMMGGADMGSALGSAPTGLFSGSLPGGGMSGTASGALGGGMSGNVAGAAPIGSATMGAYVPNTSQMMNQAQRLMQMRNQQQQQQSSVPVPNFRQSSFGNPRPPSGPIGPSMPYASFNGGTPMNNPFGFGSAYGTL